MAFGARKTVSIWKKLPLSEPIYIGPRAWFEKRHAASTVSLRDPQFGPLARRYARFAIHSANIPRRERLTRLGNN